MSEIQMVCIFLITIFGITVNVFSWTYVELEKIKHQGVLIGVLLAIDIVILIILFLGLLGVFG